MTHSRLPQARSLCLGLGLFFLAAQSLLFTLSLEETVLLGFSCFRSGRLLPAVGGRRAPYYRANPL